MSKHTPGPWKVSYHGDSLIVTSPTFPWITGQVGGHGEERDANAKLIAAAPDLLAALELIHANAGESVEWIRERTSKAIAKARGQ